jgi:hypothetical protein
VTDATERHDACVPQLDELAVFEPASLQELGHLTDDVRPRPATHRVGSEAVEDSHRGEVGGVELVVLVRRDAQQLQGDFEAEWVTPQVREEVGGFAVRINRELGDVLAEVTHR